MTLEVHNPVSYTHLDLIDLHTAHEEGITVIKAHNLPGRFACISAGNIIAECIRGKLNNGK